MGELRSLGFNTAYVNFSSAGAAWYSTRLLERVPGARDVAWESLFREARRTGIAVHGKRICLFMYLADPQVIEDAVDAGRVQRGPDGAVVRQGRFPWLCPSHPANRRLEQRAAAEIAARFPVAGIQLDYIRYPDSPGCYCERCREVFEAEMGRRTHRWPPDVLEGGADHETFLRWRSRQILKLIHEIRVAVRRVRPTIPLSATCFRDLDRAYRHHGQDVSGWARYRVVDAVVPMNYERDASRIAPLLRRQLGATRGRTRLVCGLGSYRLDHWRQLATQLETCRREGVPDVAVFAYDGEFVPTFSRAFGAR
jgi:uncharacterized lipoprotein YddW (UPF0748 family)